MLFALLVMMAAQAQSPKQETVQTVSAPYSSTAVPTSSHPAPAPPSADVIEPTPTEAEPEFEPELQTREVCRYVEVTGQRFPVRRCRTVTVEPTESH
jgi:hypothetical protein